MTKELKGSIIDNLTPEHLRNINALASKVPGGSRIFTILKETLNQSQETR
ncbi:MAG: hypothetical protein LBQ83_08130 [Candidatus Margulisbacteria bacterium]|jgi:hypothetical protein|nr:hypothetical protein [Candidatus Margulisiibacteriota bacterium]